MASRIGFVVCFGLLGVLETVLKNARSVQITMLLHRSILLSVLALQNKVNGGSKWTLKYLRVLYLWQ